MSYKEFEAGDLIYTMPGGTMFLGGREGDVLK